MMTIAKRLDTHFAAVAAAAAGAAMFGATEKADAAIVWSGIVNLNIASTTNGLYLNVVNGAINEPGNTGGSTVPGWDVNPWGSAGLNYFSASPPGSSYVQRTGGGATANLPAGTIISATPGGGRLYGTSAAATTGTDPHLLSSSNNLIGFRFFREGDLAGTVHYGWMRISLSTSLQAQPRTLVEYAYEDQVGVGIAAGDNGVPAPGALALLAVGAAGFRRRRRR